jgi:hypothetical protein
MVSIVMCAAAAVIFVATGVLKVIYHTQNRPQH